MTVIEERGANIARGRNVAITAAAHDVIAVTDADCVLDPRWLERIAEPLEAGADVSMGFYLPITEGFLQACTASVNLPIDASEVDPDTFMPSARSVAFRRGSIEAAGGYPEWLAIGEDMWVNRRWRELGLDMRFVPDAVVRWRLRPTVRRDVDPVLPLRARRRAGGDVPRTPRPAVRRVRRWYRGPRFSTTLAEGARRRWRRRVRPRTRAPGLAPLARSARAGRGDRVVPALMGLIDTAKLAGYVIGLSDRGRSRS